MTSSSSDQVDEILGSLTDQELFDLLPDKDRQLLKYCPHTPWPRQRQFLDLTCLEAFYGGAAGPGKSDAILMGALEYAHVPGYSALILRKDYQRLALSGGLIPRSHDWLAGTDAKWNGTDKRWTFPSGAKLQFGYLDTATDKYRYGSSEYQYLAFDESTEFREDDYRFMFSRCRKTVGLDVPLRMRAASNPGGEGHQWHLDRFVSDEALEAAKRGEQGIYFKGDAAFVPALIRDNPAIDEHIYRQSLIHLDPLTRERLMNGDWSVREDSLITPDMVQRYTLRGEIIIRLLGTRDIGGHDRRHMQRFCTIDTAGTSKQKAAEKKGKPPSWSVCLVWDYWPQVNALFLRHGWRKQVDWPGLKEGIRGVISAWQVPLAVIENAHHGQPLAVELQGTTQTQLVGPTIQGMKSASVGNIEGAKYERAIAAGVFEKLEKSEVYLPDIDTVPGVAAWLPAFEAELFSWTGDPEQTSDQIDALSWACNHVRTNTHAWGGVLTG